jgi:hypothetical protein
MTSRRRGRHNDKKALAMTRAGAVKVLKDDSGTRTELELTLPDAYLPTDAEAAAAAKPASGEDAATKANFWKSAVETTPGT